MQGMKVIISFRHGLRVRIEDASVYREENYNGETVMVYNKGTSFILFKGVRGYYLRSPKLWRRPVPVEVSTH